jgi:hypothetical protein
MYCVCDLEARCQPGFVVSGTSSCSNLRVIGYLDQRPDILNPPRGDSLTKRPGRLRIATRSNAGPPCGLADGDDCRDAGFRVADNLRKTQIAGFGEDRIVLHGVTSCWVTRTICACSMRYGGTKKGESRPFCSPLKQALWSQLGDVILGYIATEQATSQHSDLFPQRGAKAISKKLCHAA